MIYLSLGELVDKLAVTHNKIWHLEEQINIFTIEKASSEQIQPLLKQVASLNKLRVDIVSSIDEMFQNIKKQNNE